MSWILEVAERAGPRDPAPDDLGVPMVAVARHRAELLENPVCGGPYARAAALVHTLGRCRWLERANLTVACVVAVMYLTANGIPVDPTRDELTALARELYDLRSTAGRVAELLRAWGQGLALPPSPPVQQWRSGSARPSVTMRAALDGARGRCSVRDTRWRGRSHGSQRS